MLFQQSEYDADEAEQGGYSNYSYWRSTWRSFTKNRTAIFFMCVLGVLLLFTLVQPLLPDQKDPTLIFWVDSMPDMNHRPDAQFWFGTNSTGQDLWARIWSGTRTSLAIGIIVGLFDALLGIIIGAIWGYVRKLDRLMTEIYNVIHNIPHSIILILVSYMVKPSVATMIFAMCVTGWLPMSRFVRNQIVIIRDQEYNLASRCLGTPTFRMIMKNLLPYLISVIMLRIALAIPAAIGNEVFLTYIGLGLPVTIPSLGNLINEGRIVMMSASSRYQIVLPSIVLSVITIAFYVIGNAFSDAADPKNHV
ncbi:MAG TPA: ABC transporter permease [Clostridia bacterium]|nr:ABC transporter permease [Clostridia bacterium]HPK16973.1 ABC transporter permease [Clostridia bacterium]